MPCTTQQSGNGDLCAYVVQRLGDPQAVLVIDETGFLKKGMHSVGVKRQYSGTAGRIENCQVGVFLCYASPDSAAFIDRALYLPKEWANNPIRRAHAGVPEAVTFQTKPALAMAMLERALDARSGACRATAGHGLAASVGGVKKPDELAYYVAFAQRPGMTLKTLAQAAGRRWAIEAGFETAKQECGLDEYEARSWQAWHRHVTLVLLAQAFLVAMQLQAKKGGCRRPDRVDCRRGLAPVGALAIATISR